MLPALGLHHSNRSNGFCLADDLIEPLRPLVDDRARELYHQGARGIDPESKAGLLKLLAEDVAFAGETGPMMVNLHRYVTSLWKCYRGEEKRLSIPTALQNSVAPEEEPPPQPLVLPLWRRGENIALGWTSLKQMYSIGGMDTCLRCALGDAEPHE